MSEPIPGVAFLRVTNGLTEKVKGRYDGVDYLWKPGEVRDIPLEAAQHIFGFGQDDKSRAMNRLGWMPSSAQADEAYEKLASISFDMVEQVFQLPKQGKGKKLGNARSPVTAEGSEGGAAPKGAASPEDSDEGIDSEAI